MMGGTDWFGNIFGMVADGDVTANRIVAKLMIRAGLGVVLIRPNDKPPSCTLSAAEEKKADTAAQDAARAGGFANWDRVRHASRWGSGCGHLHALTEEKELNRARIKELLAAGANLAVSLKHCSRRVMVIDLDTDDERRAFLDLWAREAGGVDDMPLTVTSPGVYDDTAEIWKHRNGGHLWFDVPDGVELPTRVGKGSWCACHAFSSPRCPHAWAAYWGDGYVLVPPSARKEGSYVLTGSVVAAPSWLTGLLNSMPVKEHADGDRGLDTSEGNTINAWSERITWEELLTDDGFAPADYDNCGCPTFTRPGGTHEKSATGHEAGCAQYPDGTHGPVHFWSDALRIDGSATVSKLTYVTHSRYGGNTVAAMDDLGIERGGRSADVLTEFMPLLPGTAAPSSARSAEGKGDAPFDPFGAPAANGGDDEDGDDAVSAETGISVTEFWSKREVFAHIREWAIAAYVSPWAMLGSVLAYVSALTPPRVTLPDDGSLSLFVGLVGKPGVGKDQARGAAYKWLKGAIEASGLEQRAVGSGQGIGAMFMQKTKEKGDDGGADRFVTRQIRESALLTIPEIDAVYAHAKQQASTLVDTLRSAWMAEPLGGAYKDVQRDIAVPAGTYRLCLIAGIQPSKARTLLEDATGGLPQRFLWMPATDPTLPHFEYGEKPPYPEPWEWKPPVRLRHGDPFTLGGEDQVEEPGVEITMCETALRERHYLSMAKVRGEYEGDDISTHDMFGRMRVAAALALLDGRTEVTDEDWDLSDTVMRVSTYVRAKVMSGIAKEDEGRRMADQQSAVDSALAVESAREDGALDRAAKRLLHVITVAGGEWVAKGAARKRLSVPARAHMEDAVNRLVERKLIEVTEDGDVIKFRSKK